MAVLVDDVMAGFSFQTFHQELEVTLPFPCSRLALGASDFRKAGNLRGQTNLGLLQVAIDDSLQIWRVLLFAGFSCCSDVIWHTCPTGRAGAECLAEKTVLILIHLVSFCVIFAQ